MLDPLNPDIASPTPPPLSCATRVSISTIRFGFFILFHCFGFCSIPSTYSQALKETYWQNVMVEELVALETNHMQDIVPKPESGSLMGSKWVYR